MPPPAWAHRPCSPLPILAPAHPCPCQIEGSGFGGVAACGFSLGPALLALDSTPEPQLQHALEVAAFGGVRLPLGSLAFACTTHQASQQASSVTVGAAAADSAGPAGGAAAGGDGGGGSGSSGSEAFHFGGDALELFAVLGAVSWIVGGGEDGLSPPSSDVWVPANGRIRFRRHGGAARWGLPWGRQQPGGGAAAGEASYCLQVQPKGSASAGAGGPPAQRAAERSAEAELSQRQLDALMDCLDAFMLQHPGEVGAPPLAPLAAPPTAAQRSAEWVRERLGGGEPEAADGRHRS